MKTYVVFVDKIIRNRSRGGFATRTACYRREVEALDIVSACDMVREEIPNSQVSMVWPKWP